MIINVVIAVHVLVCLTLVGIVLLQQGRGADVGAVFGGSSQTVFGASGAGNLLTKTTWILAVIFFSTSLFLAYTSARRTSGSIFEGRRLLPPTGASAPLPMKNGATAPTAPAAPQAPKGSSTAGSPVGATGQTSTTAPVNLGVAGKPLGNTSSSGGKASPISGNSSGTTTNTSPPSQTRPAVP